MLIILILGGRIPLNLHLGAVGREVEHADHACAAHIRIHALWVDEHLCYNVAVVALGLESYNVIAGVMSAEDEKAFYGELMERVKTSRRKENVTSTVADTADTFNS